MEEKKKQIKKVLVVCSILILICYIFSVINKKNQTIQNEIQLTQLKANSHRQMMGYIIKTSDGKVIVIDGGTKEDEPNLVKYIEKYGNKVDAWFITHPHSDHAGAIIEIIKNRKIQINKIYYTMNDIEWYQKYAPERADEAQEFYETIKSEKIKNNIEEVSLNQIINIGFVECEILGIKNPEITEDAFNNSSMVIKMNLANNSILFLGDTGAESGDKLLETQKEKLKADIVQVAHHGQDGAKESLYKVIQPSICLWPTPEWIWNNDNGDGENTGPYTTFETRKWMKDLGVKQNIIEKDGDITIIIN